MIIFESKPLLLLCSLIILLFISPFVEMTYWGDLIMTASFTGILLSLVRMVWDHHTMQIGAGLLAACAVILLWAGDAFPQDTIWLLGEALHICLSIVIITFALIGIVQSETVDRDVLIGAVAIYLLIGITWSLIYSLVYGIDPTAFGDLLDGQPGSYWNQFVYFSFTTLTTLGYGDIVALSPVARMLSVFEAVIGVIFEAMIIARLVGLYRGSPANPESN